MNGKFPAAAETRLRNNLKMAQTSLIVIPAKTGIQGFSPGFWTLAPAPDHDPWQVPEDGVSAQ
jgi:hypothetical protein